MYGPSPANCTGDGGINRVIIVIFIYRSLKVREQYLLTLHLVNTGH